MGKEVESYTLGMQVEWQLVKEFYVTLGIPLLYGVILGVIWRWPGQADWPDWVRAIGLIGAIGGSLLWGLSYLSLGKAFGVLPRRNERVKHGVYRFFKHPMYVGIGMTFGGLAVAQTTLTGLFLVIGVLVPMLIIRARLEENNIED
jgi:protein-S-isoprenylcysteine O-methyltransferase Ste14